MSDWPANGALQQIESFSFDPSMQLDRVNAYRLTGSLLTAAPEAPANGVRYRRGGFGKLHNDYGTKICEPRPESRALAPSGAGVLGGCFLCIGHPSGRPASLLTENHVQLCNMFLNVAHVVQK